LMGIPVAGVFPVADGELYLPAPNDCVVEEQVREVNGQKDSVYTLHPAVPEATTTDEGCDWPGGMALRPVVIAREGNSKPTDKIPAWWPVGKLADWLLAKPASFDKSFLSAASSQVRDHVQLEADTGAAAESRLFATTGLSLTHLRRFVVKEGTFKDRYADITLSARVEADGWNVSILNILHPLGGERRLAHWRTNGDADLWECRSGVKDALVGAEKIRMVLATPAVFAHGWRPHWIDKDTLIGSPPDCRVKLKLVGVCIPRWKAVSGWSMQPQEDPDQPGKRIKPGPKPIKRLVPAGGVYFFEKVDDPAPLAGRWLQPVSDALQDRNDGFGLAVWGTW
jgi:CRISPR-associated protein Cmr3